MGQSFYGSRFVFRTYRNGLLPILWEVREAYHPVDFIRSINIVKDTKQIILSDNSWNCIFQNTKKEIYPLFIIPRFIQPLQFHVILKTMLI